MWMNTPITSRIPDENRRIAHNRCALLPTGTRTFLSVCPLVDEVWVDDAEGSWDDVAVTSVFSLPLSSFRRFHTAWPGWRLLALLAFTAVIITVASFNTSASFLVVIQW